MTVEIRKAKISISLLQTTTGNLQPRYQGLSSPTPNGAKDPGSGWARASQKLGGDKRTTGGRCNQVAVLSFLNSLWKEKICLKI